MHFKLCVLLCFDHGCHIQLIKDSYLLSMCFLSTNNKIEKINEIEIKKKESKARLSNQSRTTSRKDSLLSHFILLLLKQREVSQ